MVPGCFSAGKRSGTWSPA